MTRLGFMGTLFAPFLAAFGIKKQEPKHEKAKITANDLRAARDYLQKNNIEPMDDGYYWVYVAKNHELDLRPYVFSTSGGYSAACGMRFLPGKVDEAGKRAWSNNTWLQAKKVGVSLKLSLDNGKTTRGFPFNG